ncbi:helicase-associated domain-containing protein [Microbacterium sp. TNHR37B]|uniref:helicase-associated domain-containing protein n=1 Tax=Microbacterium sp. TNHR37B TaxID=1775956 RepID=UPI0007B30BBD|nr:helicase-associated domain-containing protein [Microbacterium sp. TNHR37B]KZE91589.1 hypothetical protein AVP41_01133 [Microbacterium sp. TNHR37B]
MAAPDARTLATLLATLDDASLAALLDERRILPSVGWDDYFDAADALLDPASVARGLASLSREPAEALSAAIDASEPVTPGSVRDELVRRALVTPDGDPYRAVATACPPLTPDPDLPRSTEAVAEQDAAQAAERAFASATSLADVLQSALALPLTRIGSGALGASDRRRLVEAHAVETADAADELLAISAAAGLVTGTDRQWLVTSRGVDWLALRTVSRWHEVARRVRDALPAGLRLRDGGWIPVSQWAGAYPFDPTWPERAERWRVLFERWALIGPQGAVPPWAAGLADGHDADEAALQALLPIEVDRVFLQNDLTAIAPGPLEPALDMRLRSMAHRETRAQASTYRFTAESLSAALTAGETAESLREFLSSLSLTGLPQPLVYEIERNARRHGNVQVGPDGAGNTRVTADDRSLLQALAVDQALRPLGLVTDADGLLTRSAPETTFWMLADARYPVTAVDVDGRPRVLDRHRVAAEAPAQPASEVYAPVLARLRDAHDTDADSAWLGRELEQAVRAHAVLAIVVRLPDGSDREITMEATGLGGGRLRGRDRVADVERTLPVSSIVSIRPVSG